MTKDIHLCVECEHCTPNGMLMDCTVVSWDCNAKRVEETNLVTGRHSS